MHRGTDMMPNIYDTMKRDYGFSYNTTATVRKMTCPRCGFQFSLAYARAISCQGCSEAVKGCPKVRCGKCDYEFFLSQGGMVRNGAQQRDLADHICRIVNDRYEGRGIEAYNR